MLSIYRKFKSNIQFSYLTGTTKQDFDVLVDQALAELHESNKVVTKAMLYKTRTSYQIKVLRAHKDHANTLITLIHRVREHDEYTRIYHLAKHSKNVSLSSISLLESLTKQPK